MLATQTNSAGPQADRPGGAERNLPDRVADRLIARIFTRDLRPGDRLPAERTLAEQLGVDRSSLRMALRQLSRMGVIRSVQGSGISVLDWEQHAGVDFLAAVFDNPDLELGGGFLTESLLAWLQFAPQALSIGLGQAPAADLQRIAGITRQQLDALANGAPIGVVVDLEVQLQDESMGRLSSTLLTLLRNSTRPLRRRLVALAFECSDAGAHVRFQRELLQAASGGELPAAELARRYGAYLQEFTRPLRRRLAELPTEPKMRPGRAGPMQQP